MEVWRKCSSGLAWGAVILVGVVLQSCGGGGDNGDSPSPQAVVACVPPVTEDPLFSDQWHLCNTGQQGGTPGEDVRVVNAWARNLLGAGIRIHVVDDGMEITHEDLSPNVLSGQGYNFLHPANGCGLQYTCTPNGKPASDPTPLSGESHGTAASGVAAASANRLGVRGAAPSARLVGYNLLAVPNALGLDSAQATAMSNNRMLAHINTNSWGPPDSGFLQAAAPAWRTEMFNGVVSGRGGLGTLYTWAAGNGGRDNDNSNYDGYANNPNVLAICSVNAQGRKARHSEKGANLLVCAPSRDDGLPGITTTDLAGTAGSNNGAEPTEISNPSYTNDFSGTSAATPSAAGVIALMLEANPELRFRDVRLILAETARRNDAGDSDWAEVGLDTRGARYHHNHKYGFGVIDADAATQRAATWTNVGPLRNHLTQLRAPNIPIPDNNPTGVSDPMRVSGSGITNIEFLQVTFSASDHTLFGDLDVALKNVTTGTVSQLAEQHPCSQEDQDGNLRPVDCRGGYNGWTFSTTRHLGESADAEWRLEVRDLAAQDIGTFQNWQLTFSGR